MRRHLPRFSTAEWCALVDALKQVPEAWSPSYIFAEVHDAREASGRSGGLIRPPLVQRLQALPYVESVAVVDGRRAVLGQ